MKLRKYTEAQLRRAVRSSEYLTNSASIQSYKLKNRLLKDGVFAHKCTGCCRAKWLGRPVPLELDHINGENKDNRLENLRLLCPNCHALTTTYRSKNRKPAKA